MLIIFDLERTNQLNPLPDKDLVDLCPPIEPYQVTKSHYKLGLIIININKPLPQIGKVLIR
ncbi:Glycogen phosphorylase [Microcystis aeruginosa NIES-98]|nr:Glycogen phosphorylase [Microcystis aeruginosa NIES-98]